MEWKSRWGRAGAKAATGEKQGWGRKREAGAGTGFRMEIRLGQGSGQNHPWHQKKTARELGVAPGQGRGESSLRRVGEKEGIPEGSVSRERGGGSH